LKIQKPDEMKNELLKSIIDQNNSIIAQNQTIINGLNDSPESGDNNTQPPTPTKPTTKPTPKPSPDPEPQPEPEPEDEDRYNRTAEAQALLDRIKK